MDKTSSAREVAEILSLFLPEHKGGLIIEHNIGSSLTVLEVLEGYEKMRIDWGDPSARQRSIETNEIWMIQWYPDIGKSFNLIAAPTLGELLGLALLHKQMESKKNG